MFRWLRRLFAVPTGNTLRIKPVVKVTARVYREKTGSWEDVPVSLVSL